MKNKLTISFFLIFISLLAFSETSFFVEPYSGFTYGSMNKYIFSSKGEKKLSCLEWETKPLFFLGTKIGFSTESFEVYGKVDVSLPGICGKMYDSDFYYSEEFPEGNICNYTIHDNESLENINTQIGLQYNSKVTEKLYFKPSFDLQYTFDSFVSKNGHGWYGKSDYSTTGKNESYDSPYAKKVRVLGVEYYRHTFYSWIGADLVIVPDVFGSNNLNFLLGLRVSPFTYTSSMDHHLSNKGNDYHQQEIEYSYFTRIKLNGGLSYRLNQKVSIMFETSLIYGTLEKGDTYSDRNNSKGMEKTNQKTGADIMQFRAGLGCKIRL